MNEEIERMRAALTLIAGNCCEHSTRGPGSCWSDSARIPDAEYTSERWCDRCIALAALLPDAPAKRLAVECGASRP